MGTAITLIYPPLANAAAGTTARDFFTPEKHRDGGILMAFHRSGGYYDRSEPALTVHLTIFLLY